MVSSYLFIINFCLLIQWYHNLFTPFCIPFFRNKDYIELIEGLAGMKVKCKKDAIILDLGKNVTSSGDANTEVEIKMSGNSVDNVKVTPELMDVEAKDICEAVVESNRTRDLSSLLQSRLHTNQPLMTELESLRNELVILFCSSEIYHLCA